MATSRAALTGASSLAVPCSDTDADVAAAPGALGPASPESRGALLRCAKDGHLSVEELSQRLAVTGYHGRGPQTGASVFRVLYRTERGGPTYLPGFSSALVYLPDVPRAAKVPVVVTSHGSRGQAPRCAPSLRDPAAADVDNDFEAAVLPLVGAGFAVIAPDLAGYAGFGAPGNPPSGYAFAGDVGKSTLDGARALRNLAPDAFTGDVVLTGHSQGGHTALSALALAETYGAGGTIVAVAVNAPLWVSQRAWGALFLEAGTYSFTKSPPQGAVSVWYHYTHAALLDGPEHALDVFREDKRAAIQSFVDGTCWQSGGYPQLEALGSTVLDLFDPWFIASVTLSAGTGLPCLGNPVCRTWLDRYSKDRPHLTGSAAQVPILFNYGAKDTTIAPGYMQCAVDRLEGDKVGLEACVDPAADHSGIVVSQADRTVDWVASHTALGPAPAPCAHGLEAIVDANGKPAKCSWPPPND